MPPPVSPEAAPDQAPSPVEAPAPAAPETDRPKEGANQNAGMPLPPVQDTPVVTPPKTDDTPAKDTGPVVSGAPAIADDVDVLEKEWVEKAKEIVDNSKDDPHKQNKEVSVLKADYMKKRYGKDIKLAKD